MNNTDIINRWNEAFKNIGSNIRVTSRNVNSIEFNTGFIYHGNNLVLYNSIFEINSDVYRKQVDNLLASKESFDEIKSKLSSLVQSERSSTTVQTKRNKCVEKYNILLANNNISTRVVSWTDDGMLFSTGYLYKDRVQKLIIKLFKSTNHRWIERADQLLIDQKSFDEISKQIEYEARSFANAKMKEMYPDWKEKSIFQKGHVPWNKGLIGPDNPNYGKLHSEEQNRRLSETRKGSGNPMYGTHMTEEAKLAKSNMMKQRILNGEFTPNSNNRFTQKNVPYKDKKFRSSWEVLFYALNPDYQYEKLRIKYAGKDSKDHVYIVDFVNHEKKIAVEIKPKELLNKQNNDIKINALKQWCIDNKYECKIITQYEIRDMMINNNLDDLGLPEKVISNLNIAKRAIDNETDKTNRN